jgi:hypothetical protein
MGVAGLIATCKGAEQRDSGRGMPATACDQGYGQGGRLQPIFGVS